MSAKLFAENRRRLCQGLGATPAPPGAVVLLQGGEQKQRYCTDVEDLFRQVGHTAWVLLGQTLGCLSEVSPSWGGNLIS